MKSIFAIVFLFLSFQTFAQRVKVTDINPDYFRHANVGGFYYLHDELGEDAYEWIADLNVTFDSIYPSTISDIYGVLKGKANRMYANSFRVISSDIYALGQKKHVKIGIYYLRMERRALNRSLFPRNKAYLFGFLGYHQNISGYPIEINEEKILLEELRYKEINLSEGERLSLKIGKGTKSNIIKIEGKKEMQSYFFKFDMFKGFVGRAQIDQYDWSVGEFLRKILKREVHK